MVNSFDFDSPHGMKPGSDLISGNQGKFPMLIVFWVEGNHIPIYLGSL